MEEIRKYLSLHSKITDNAWAELSSLLKEEEINKKDFFVKAGKVCSKIGFLKSGFLRAYYCDEKRKEKTVYFNFLARNPFVSDFESFISENKSRLNVQAITKCRIIFIDRRALYKLYESHPSIERLGRVLAERHYLDALDRIRNFKTEATNRYKILSEKYPELVHNIPSNMIANYLDITETSLSRIKRDIYTSSKKLPYGKK